MFTICLYCINKETQEMNNVKTVVFLYLLESCMFDKNDNIPKYIAKHTLTN